MNSKNFDKIIQEYMNHFELINNAEHKEYSKWIAFKSFHDNFDVEADDFASMFKNAIKDSIWLADNAMVCPTNGVVYFSQREDTKEQVREMFRRLYADDGGDLSVRLAKIWQFHDDFNAMVTKYEPNKWKFKQEFRTALLYLTLMFPDENYPYKPSQAHAFANCIEYDRDIGNGRSFSLKNYYHMCDMIVEKIKETPDLLELQKRRIVSDAYKDEQYHLLAFDIIYCAVAYNMYAGIEVKKPKKMSATERAELARIENINNQLSDAQQELQEVLEIYDSIENISIVDMTIEHKEYGIGKVTEQNQTLVTIAFPEKIVKFQFPAGFKVGKLILEDDTLEEYFTLLYDTLAKKKKLEDRIKSLQSSLS